MPAFLLIDVGNTRLKWAEAKATRAIRVLGNIPTPKVTLTWARALKKKFPRHLFVVSSVVPMATTKLKLGLGTETIFATSKTAGLTFNYPKPTELGADRLAASVAVEGPAIVVACGTATAFSVLDRHGRFCGGVIAPGLATQLSSLLGAAAQLPKITLSLNAPVMARSTREAIQAGVILNFQGGFREIIVRLAREMKCKPRVILTGGYAAFLKGSKISGTEVRPLLVFEGLHIIGQRFSSASR